MPDNSAPTSNTPLSKEQLDALAMSIEKYKNSLEEFEQLEAEMLKTVMNEMQTNSKEEARKRLHNLLASQ